MNRGYSGFYKETFLRSSYEYAYAKFLDFHEIQWRYEQETYFIGDESYKPDFFIYKNEVLVKIVEIKSAIIEEIEMAIKKVEKLEIQIDVQCELISYEGLKRIYKTMPFTLNSVIQEWINSDKTTIQKKWNGKKNPHYGLKHSEETKRRIGEKTRERWQTNNQSKLNMIEGLRKSGLTQKGKLKSPRVKVKCLECKKAFEKTLASVQKYCCGSCVMVNARRIQKANYSTERATIHNLIKTKVDQWAVLNEEIVMHTPYNKIKMNLSPLLSEIEEEFNVKDIRVVTSSVLGKNTQSGKDLLKYMKEKLK